MNIVVLQAGGCRFGVVVDRVTDTQEIVVKPLGAQLKDVTTYAGATVMGDGKVALILDVLGLADRAGLLAETTEAPTDRGAAAAEAASDRENLLVVAVGDGRRCAIPLAEVARLEEFAADTVEHAGHREVVQYRGHILPLLRLSSALGIGAGPHGESLPVVVIGEGEAAVGIVVDGIVDIVDEQLSLVEDEQRTHIRGSVVISGRVTDVVDIIHVAALAATHQPSAFAGF